MPPGLTDIAWLSGIFLLSLGCMFIFAPRFMRYLRARGRLADDVHKVGAPAVPSPMGPVIFASLVAGEFTAYLVYGTLVPLALVAIMAVTFVIGLYDDLFGLGGVAKPSLLLLAAGPLVLLDIVHPSLYDPRLFFPILGPTSSHFSIFTVLVIAAIPVVSNAYNMMDSFNGEISGFTLLTAAALIIALALKGLSQGFSGLDLATALPLLAVSLGFFAYNRYPSKAFDGDSGSLVFGSLFAGLAITGGVEIAAVVAIIPAILNSFYVLSSVRGLVERRRMKARPTYLGEDGKLHAAESESAPTTLVRLLLLNGPLSEKELVRSILAVTAWSCLLSVLTSALTW